MKADSVFILLLASVTLLTGCQEDITYSYLMRHPDYLQKESLRCSVTQAEEAAEITHCALVARAMTDFFNMASIQQKQPEKFGLLVMSTETDFVNAGIAMRRAKNAMHDAKDRIDKHAYDVASEQYKEAEKKHQQKQEELGVLYAILRAHSPE